MAEKTRNETAADEELKTLRERLKACEFLLIGLGSEWEKAGGAEVQEAYRALASMRPHGVPLTENICWPTS